MASAGDAGFSNNNGADLTSNGQRSRSNNFQIDGQANNDNSVAGPTFFVSNTDIIGEFQVITNNFSAEYGRNAGSVVNYVTKSGTNNFHGSAFWYHENSSTYSLANDEKAERFGFCAPGVDPNGPDGIPDSGDETCAAVEKPKQRENRFGLTLGGPVVTDKLWFFGSFQNWLVRGSGSPSNSGTAITPTPTGYGQLLAAFPASPGVQFINAFGPYTVPTGGPTPLNPFDLRVCDAAACAPIEFANISRNAPNRSEQRDWSGRVDWQITDKDRFFARYLFQNFVTPVGAGTVTTGAWVDVPGSAQQIGLDWSRTWTSHFINQFRYNFSRGGFGFEGGGFGFCTRASILDCPSRVNFTSSTQLDPRPGATGSITAQTFSLATNLPQGRLINNTLFQDNASWVMGRHSLKFGGEYGRQRSPNVFLPNINGAFNFQGNVGCGTFPEALGATQCAWSNFIRNTPVNAQLADGPPSFPFKEQDMAFYFQDDWRILDNLTLNLGIRWEWFEQAVNLLNDLTAARESDPATAFWDTTLDSSLTTVPAVPEDRNNWGPNVGFAWTPRIWEGLFGRDKTVIRGGYRVAYDPAYYNIFLNMATAAPTVNLGTFTGVGLPAGGNATGAGLRAAGYLGFIPTGVNPGLRNQTQVSGDFHNPMTQQWSLGVQRQITPKIAGEVRYVGNHTSGNFQTINANPALRSAFGGFLFDDFPDLVPAGVTPCTDPAAPGFAEGRIDCNRRLVRARTNTAFAIYHGLQSRLDFQNWHGFTGGATYTWSRAIDNVSEIFATGGGGNTNAISQNPFDFNVPERGISGYSFPHVFTMHWVYELPFYKSQQGIMGHILGGWQLNGIYRFQSGQPYTASQAWFSAYCDTNFGLSFIGVDACRPILSNDGAPLTSVGEFCNGFSNCFDGGGNPIAPGPTAFMSSDDPCKGDDTGCAATMIDPSSVHWILNDETAALILGSPFLGVGRNTLRGQTINNVDAGIFKNTKVSEKITVQFQANAFNLFNRQFRGVPDAFIDDGPDERFSNLFNPSVQGNDRRLFIFGLKLIF
jgi:hypothetical protein